MKKMILNEKWILRREFCDSLEAMERCPGEEVNLPHDCMISTPVSPDAVSGTDSGFFKGGVCNYTKYLYIPKEWEEDSLGLYFDGAMMNAVVEVNGCKAGSRHYGYVPFYVDLTDLVSFGEENRITIHTKTSTESYSRWYTGLGLYRGVELLHGPKVHVVPNGIYVYTKEISDNIAFLEAEIDVENVLPQTRHVHVEVFLVEDKDGKSADISEAAAYGKQIIQIKSGSRETARVTFHVDNPKLWDADNPNLYHVIVRIKNLGVFRTHLIEDEVQTVDEAEILYGIRTVTADAIRGLQINGKTVKLKGGCVHHDNGLLGAVSLYETEARKVKKLKEVGFNAIRTAHNPPSEALIEACDRLGMYVFDEAFDAWGVAKRCGDYSLYFDSDWEKDITAFVKRDRSHPSVILWSTGNEIPERGGLNDGYSIATKLANKIRELDGTRLISNGICSYWGGLDDYRMEGKMRSQNEMDDTENAVWEKWSEPFVNGLDVVGYNYMEDLYERDHEMYPDRIILGSENFPKEIGFRWPMVERLPYVIGEFTWTAWDYIGEAGVGKTLYVDKDDPIIEKYPAVLFPQFSSFYPWRLASDADYDITGKLRPQGAYRSVVWGNDKTYLYAYSPDQYGKVELLSLWGFPDVQKNWNYEGMEGKPVKLMIFSAAQEVEVLVNGKSIGRKPVETERPFPRSVCFETEYQPGIVEAISYTDGNEVSRDSIETTDKPYSIDLHCEKQQMKADGQDAIYVEVNIVDKDGRLVPDAEIDLQAHISLESDDDKMDVNEVAYLACFGTGNPITEENYTDDQTISYRGHAMAILRSGYKGGMVRLSVIAEGLPEASVELEVEEV